ncbi:MAG TPA: alpha-galactosidase [Phycisphaerae bacterium]|nr:alpha-galactosidase [Phycisphaerae bacterium]HRY66630.1 alpha-galactosidase [Phycisphaerae bacterium]HSA29087.1 alpha-galactosidase [Phycisphaerae bacterium]
MHDRHSLFTTRLNAVAAVCVLCAAGGSRLSAAEQKLDGSVIQTLGEWRIEFQPADSTLACVHAASGAEIIGTLSFTAEIDGQRQPWSIGRGRDSAPRRLSLIDAAGDVQGYLTFSGSGTSLNVTVAHRSAQSYKGELAFRATARLGNRSFACRTRPPIGSRVVQMASGPADSGLNDSLFDVDTDTALRLTGRTLAIRSPAGQVGPRHFELVMSASPQAADGATLAFELLRDYYRSRYVPFYRPIDRKRCPSPPTGWMSWNVYFDKAGEEDNLAEARVGARYLKPFGLEIWHIESWQDNSDRLPVSKFHNLTLRPDPRKFPHGMKWLADRIRELGFRPGIWTVPFGTGDRAFYDTHKNWFLHHPDGQPMHNWCGYYVLDPSLPAVRQHMEDTHRIMSQEWGYEYFKIDGMSGRGPSYSAHFYERPEVRAAFRESCEGPFRLCVEALRRGLGPDRIWLACQGHYTGPEVGQADAARLGADIVSPNEPPHWANYLHQAQTTLNQLFVHNIVWYNDPDTLLVGEAAPLNTARIAATAVGLPGQVMFAGDKLADLPAERMRLLQQCLPVCDVRPLDLFPLFELHPIWALKISRPFGTWDVVSLFNWKDESAELRVRFDELGLPADRHHLVYDFWGQSFLGSFRESLSMPLAGRSNALLAVHPDTGRPQFLSSDRHITQGGVEVEQVAWDEVRSTLSGRVRLVEHVPARLTCLVPRGYEFASAKAGDEVELRAERQPDRTLVVTLEAATPSTATWEIACTHLQP